MVRYCGKFFGNDWWIKGCIAGLLLSACPKNYPLLSYTVSNCDGTKFPQVFSDNGFRA